MFCLARVEPCTPTLSRAERVPLSSGPVPGFPFFQFQIQFQIENQEQVQIRIWVQSFAFIPRHCFS
jgi:hypothetical protein